MVSESFFVLVFLGIHRFKTSFGLKFNNSQSFPFLFAITINISSLGLGTIYGINALLCVVAFFKAKERGQSAPIWIAKTLTVGGLALDQLSQLPTTEQIEKAKARKGKRALRNMKK